MGGPQRLSFCTMLLNITDLEKKYTIIAIKLADETRMSEMVNNYKREVMHPYLSGLLNLA